MGEFAVIRAVKHKFSSSVAGIGKHMNREIQTDNADKSRWSENQSWTLQHEFRTWAEAPPIKNFQALELARRIALLHDGGGKIQKNSVLAIELMCSASPTAFERESFDLKQWAIANVQFFQQTFGQDNILDLVLHVDEKTPHLHAIIFPLIFSPETRGRRPADDSAQKLKPHKPRLAASRWLNGRAALARLQTNYAQAMGPFGLARGQERSTAQHGLIKKFYGAITRLDNREKNLTRTFLQLIDHLPVPRLTSWSKDSAELRRKKAELAARAIQMAKLISDLESNLLQLEQRFIAQSHQYKGLKNSLGGEVPSAELLHRTKSLRISEEHRKALEESLSVHISELDAKTAELQDWKVYASELEQERNTLLKEAESVGAPSPACLTPG